MDGTSFAQQDEEAKLRGQFWLKLASMVFESRFVRHYKNNLKQGEEVESEQELQELLQEWTEVFNDFEIQEERQEGLDMISHIQEILYSTSTLESQAKERGQDWSNLGRKLF